MANVRDITTKCKEGQVQKAYNIAKADFVAMPTDVWKQRELGWALYYMIKGHSCISPWQYNHVIQRS